MVAQVCIFRNAIRRALKGISEALDRLEGSQAGAADTLQACRAVTTVVGQIAQSVHRLQQVGPIAVASSCHTAIATSSNTRSAVAAGSMFVSSICCICSYCKCKFIDLQMQALLPTFLQKALTLSLNFCQLKNVQLPCW